MAAEYLDDSFCRILKETPASSAICGGNPGLGQLLCEAQMIRRQRFGNRINLYAPLYISNFCENECVYCGFNRKVSENRAALSRREILREGAYLKSKGIESLLVVSGEDRTMAGFDYLLDAVRSLSELFSYLAIEVSPFSREEYEKLYGAGLDGVTVYQETYDEKLYDSYHRGGMKTDFRYRLETPERAALAGIPNITVGALLGLAPWQVEMTRLAAHLRYLTRKYWKVSFGVSFPRITEAGTGFKAPYPVSDRDFAAIIALMRKQFPDSPIYLSTREKPFMRDNLARYGVTHMSAESKTLPGGYTGSDGACSQFGVSDTRSIEGICRLLNESGLRPVFKDWDRGYRRIGVPAETEAI